MADPVALASHGTLFGRDRELGLLRSRLDAAASGRGSVLVMRGEAGIGKTALLGALRAEAERRKLTVLAAAGVESESSLPFATLHQLLGPLLSEIDSLPAPHPQALRAAFGLGGGQPDPYAVALAALELVADAATIKPVVLILDDAQWLDTASADAITFLSRRITNDAVLAVGATRTVALNDPLRRSGLADTYVRRLGDADATALLKAQAPELTAAVRDRVLAEAAGNPLALVELPRALGQNPAGGSLEVEFPLNDRLEATFAARIGDLGNRARTLLIVLAADVNCDLRRLLAASSQAAGEAVTIGDAQSAIDVGLVEPVSTMLRFRHPLMRSAVYRQANLLERFAAHGALADQLAAFPDRRLWHLASAALGADESLADELEGYAARAQARGAATSAVAALRRAAELTDEHQRATSFLLRATELASELGARHEAERLLQDSDLDQLGPIERGRLANVLEIIRFSGFPDPEQRVRELIDMASEAHAAGDRILPVMLLWRAASRCFLQLISSETRRAVARTLDTLGLPDHDPRVLAILAYTVPEDRGDKIIEHLHRPTIDPTDVDARRFLGSAALAMGEFPLGVSYVDAAGTACRTHRRLGVLSRLLGAANWGHVWICLWDRVRSESEESEESGCLTLDTGEEVYGQVTRINLAAVSVLRGDLTTATTLVTEVAAHPTVASMRSILVATAQINGLISLLSDRAVNAYWTIARAFDPADPTYHRYMCWWLVPELADAALAADQVEHARALVAPLPGLADRVQAGMLVVAARYSEAVLASDDAADAAFARALACDLTAWPFYRARLQLHLGRRRRRQRRLREARDLLRTARDAFDALGADPWSDQARIELRAAGESSRRRTAHIRDQLSAQELHIATLAAQGLTNRQIAERLFLSHRTVDSHLYRIYPRLGITSRAEIAAALEVAQKA